LAGVIVALTISLPFAAAHAQSADFVLSCQSIASRTTVADLRQRYGNTSVVDAPVAAPDGGREPGTVIFPETPDRRIEIRWADAAHTRMASFTTFEKKSVWRTPEGLGNGTAIAEVDLINGRSFLLKHFEYPGGGYALSWAGGKLTKSSEGTCALVVRLAPGVTEFSQAELKLVEAIASTEDVSSDDRRIKPYKAAVASLGLAWRD
jgi:hypothetical protein